MKATVLATALLLAAPALAQDTPTFTTADAELMTACVDTPTEATEQGGGLPYRECVGSASDVCMETEEGGYSTIGMTQCLQRETDWWDSQLNAAYATLEETLEADLFAELQAVQRVWIDYRDQACMFDYNFWGDGSMRSVSHATCMLNQTADRAASLYAYANMGI